MSQNTSRYIIKLSNELLCIYYDKFDGICFKQYINNHWNNPSVVYKDGSHNFSVTLSNDQQLYLFCQDKKGSIILCNYTANKWKSKILKDNKSSEIYNIIFHAVIKNNVMNLFYNLYDELEKRHHLINTTLSSDAMWSIPNEIDEIIPINKYPYIIQKISADHYILYYQIRRRENILGYRELSAVQNKFSDFKIIHSTIYQITDTAFLTTTDTIHALYVVISMFSSRLIYTKKHGAQFSIPVCIFESQRIENIIIFILENQIWITFYSNGILYFSTSTNKGESFSRPQRYREQIYGTVNRTIYLANEEQNENELYLSTLYTSEDTATDILLISDLYPNFYVNTTQSKNQRPEPKTNPQFYEYSLGEEENLTILNNKLSQTLSATKEKDIQLIELTNILKEKNEHISHIELQWRKKFKELKEENDELKKELEELKKNEALIAPSPVLSIPSAPLLLTSNKPLE